MAAFAVTGIERHRRAVPAPGFPHHSLEFVAVHTEVIAHICANVNLTDQTKPPAKTMRSAGG